MLNSGKSYRLAFEGEAVIIWVKGRFDAVTAFDIRKRFIG